MSALWVGLRRLADNELMSFDVAVLAMDESADAAAARAMFERCNTSGNHAEGELDDRIAGFYDQLRVRFPDYPPYPEDSPWMMMPLATGIDHVIMNLSFSPRGDTALMAIMELAAEYRLVVLDLQSDSTYLPEA
jgi:hypothetical protein